MKTAAIAASLFLIGCPSEEPEDDGGAVTPDGGEMDAGGGGDACMGEADGTECGTGLICIAEACVASACGDGYLDEAGGEVCDDGNEVAFDGCEPGTCTYTCEDSSVCDDGQECNGAEVCDDTHTCAFGTPLADGTACDLAATDDGVCRAGDCVDPGCGNGVVDGAEQCDDGNETGGDGCETDCTFTCEDDVDCIDGDVCNGEEACDTATHVCTPGTSLDCSDGDDCTADECHPTDGCQNPLIDMDGDGHADVALGACGDDCDDSRADVFTGAEELCDGVDNNCNVDIDETAPTWYVDCDEDGYSPDTSVTRTGCTEPPASATGCPSGGRWTTVRPSGMGSTDCHDGNPDVFPGQTTYFSTTYVPASGSGSSWDYNCDGTASRRYGCTPSSGGCGSRCSGGYLPSDRDNPNGCEYLCLIGGSCAVFNYPSCGETAAYLECSGFGSVCRTTPASSRRQPCR